MQIQHSLEISTLLAPIIGQLLARGITGQPLAHNTIMAQHNGTFHQIDERSATLTKRKPARLSKGLLIQC